MEVCPRHQQHRARPGIAAKLNRAMKLSFPLSSVSRGSWKLAVPGLVLLVPHKFTEREILAALPQMPPVHPV